ncbi:PEP/pyruvate-binding domain-containing protein [Nocardia africana]|uniref:Phosphoenolpyruvate synthase n=1 Tax=Nocardia africana TaxID=134964 RepID=A0A378WVG8_9NOCA|nr:PEP/pyruvate-binding domain-containing protein [Nocardia africana]MCC3313776.1 PEP/pyruvate-binding domain-containing protein [Nocardia africana]SUA44842.1 Phosphoenolpyruvate synthase [Nocardia africana]
MAEHIVWLDRLDASTATTVAGPKAGRLAELAAIGLRVPRGFAVTADCYRRFCAESELDAFVSEQLATLSDVRDCARVADVIGTEFARRPMADAIESAITDAYAELNFRCLEVNQPVAVRSSAIGEDGGHTSFAGMFDSYLGVSGTERVLGAVRRCWASLFSARALSYRLGRGVSAADMPMAVAVLELVSARASGVAFSIHPVTGRRDRIVLESTWGYGETVVRGAVTPDHIEVGRTDRRMLAYEIADKNVVAAFDYARGEVVDTVMPARFRRAASVDEDHIAAVVDAVCAIEEYFGYPVDVEWVIERSRCPGEPVTIVQARPVTRTAEPAIVWDLAEYAYRYAFGGSS